MTREEEKAIQMVAVLIREIASTAVGFFIIYILSGMEYFVRHRVTDDLDNH